MKNEWKWKKKIWREMDLKDSVCSSAAVLAGKKITNSYVLTSPVLAANQPAALSSRWRLAPSCCTTTMKSCHYYDTP
jgi:hypothetical protein